MLLSKMDGSNAGAALNGFTRSFEQVPAGRRLTMAYDRGPEMVAFADWPRR